MTRHNPSLSDSMTRPQWDRLWAAVPNKKAPPNQDHIIIVTGKAAGLTRLELYVHPEDHSAIKAYAEKLLRKRTKDRSKHGES